MEKILTQREKAEAFNKILNKGKECSIDEIKIYIKKLYELGRAGVLKYAEDEKDSAIEFIDNFRAMNPSNRNYPYTNYNHYQDAVAVIEIIKKCQEEELLKNDNYKEKKTQYEKEFFSITEKFCFTFDEKGFKDYDSFNYKLFNNIDNFQAEIIENITSLSSIDREFYLNRITNRLNQIKEGFLANDETGKLEPIGIRFTVEGKSSDNKFEMEPEKVQGYFDMIKIYKKQMLDFVNNLQSQQIENGSKTEIPILSEIKPMFSPEYIDAIFELLKDFFRQEHQAELKRILQTGDNADTKLLFLDSGNRLADAFKQLKEADFIIGCKKTELETWIQKNFCYRYKNKNKVNSFTLKYLNIIISSSWSVCKNPILNVKADKTSGKMFITKT